MTGPDGDWPLPLEQLLEHDDAAASRLYTIVAGA
jgi:hypothetical protein